MKIWIAMSGGVDSSAAACLIKKGLFGSGVPAGAEPAGETECTGVMLRLLPRKAGNRANELSPDEADAAAVAGKLGLPFRLLDEHEVFRCTVMQDFADIYAAGGTPNPCIVCNRTIKFGRLLEAALSAGADKIATGHYARISYDPESERYQLKKAADPGKDQSYMLYGLSQEQLSHILLPLGGYTKEESRAIAEEAGLITAHKHDSQDICFIPDGDYAAFLERFTGMVPEPGDFITPDGKVLGRHRGIIHYTIGQRKGLGISSEAALFVTRIDPAAGTVTLSHGEGLFRDTVHTGPVNWVSIAPPEAPIRVEAKLRYRHKAKPALLIPGQDGSVTLQFDEPQRAVTPGQSAVFYDGELLLGGGIITG